MLAICCKPFTPIFSQNQLVLQLYDFTTSAIAKSIVANIFIQLPFSCIIFQLSITESVCIIFPACTFSTVTVYFFMYNKMSFLNTIHFVFLTKQWLVVLH